MRSVLTLLNAQAGTLIDARTEDIVRQINETLKPRCESLEVCLLQPRALPEAIRRGGTRTS